MKRRWILLVEQMQKNAGVNFDQTDADRLASNFNPDNVAEGTNKSNYTS